MRQLAAKLIATVLCAAGAAHAQKAAPGLWEHTMTMKTQSGQMEAAMAQMQAQLSKMSPEQRKQMEAMMGGRAGAGMAMAGGKPTVVKVCLTPEQAARDEIPQSQGNCQRQSYERTGNTVKFKFSCTGPNPSTGTGEFTFVSDRQHQGRMRIETTLRGQPERIEMEQSGRWLAADCGNVKPLPAAPAVK